MYVTRPLSRYLADPNAAAEPPPEGPGSGFLVVVDETGETASKCCFGLCVDREMRGLPFPQNRQLELRPNTCPDTLELCATFVAFLSEVVGSLAGIDCRTELEMVDIPDYAMLVPVIGQPLSSGRYYVVKADGKHRGKVSACSKEEDKTTCCCCSCINDVKPRPFDHGDIYQQVEVQRLPSGNKLKGFKAVAVATDGIPPHYLRKKGWKVNTIKSPKYDLTDNAQGVDSDRRSQMPDLESLSIAAKSSPPVVVGKWYVPFMFVKADGMFIKADGCFVKSDGKHSLKDQSRKSMFYEMTLEQSWEQIYSRHNSGSEPAEVAVTATVRRSTAVVDGTSVVPKEESRSVWFRPAAAGETTGTVALDMVVWERMRWELERGGWVAPGNGEQERIERVERRDGLGQWHKFACYLLVERFLLKRMAGSVALTCEYRHTDKIKAKWL